MNAISLLKSDHKKVKELFAKIKIADETQYKKLYEKIRTELEVHTHIEELILYPQMRQIEELKDNVLEGVEEHHQAKLIMREIDNLVENNKEFEPELKVLIEDMEYHIKEEEKVIFPKIKKFFDNETLDIIGGKLKSQKEKYQNAVIVTLSKQ